ncbi:MAG: hypothetical protein AAF962_03620 [Actinomycetota bacterium]
MHELPTTSDLTKLGESVARDGFRPHHNRVVDLVALARKAEVEIASLAELENPAAPDVVRARALAHLTSRWDGVRKELGDRQVRFDTAVADLLTAWNDHEDLRRSNPDIKELAASSRALDRLRLEASRYRHGLVGT